MNIEKLIHLFQDTPQKITQALPAQSPNALQKIQQTLSVKSENSANAISQAMPDQYKISSKFNILKKPRHFLGD